MRGRLRAVALLALLLLGAGSPTASGQEPVAQPAYRTGDFWNYTVDVGPNVPLLGPDSDMSAQGHRRVEVVGTSTDGDGRPAYEVEVGWRLNMSGTFVLLGAEVGVSGRLRSNGTSLWAVDGLDTLSSTETAHLSLVVEWFGSFERLEVDASSEVTYAYGEDTWAFPLEVGSEGREEVEVSVESSTETRGFGVVVRNDTAFQASATLRHRVEGEGSVVTPAGEFPVVTVRSEFQTADPRLTEFLLAGATVEVSSWSGEVGAPVRSELRHTGGSRVAVLELMEHRYQAAEASLLLGLSPQLLLGIAGSGAAVAAVLLLLLRRRRAPTAPADDVPPAEPGGPERE